MQSLVKFFVITLAVSSCKAPVPPSGVSAVDQNGFTGDMSIAISENGTTRFVPKNTNDKITKVNAVAATLAMNSQAVVPSKTPVAVGTITLGKVSYELNSNTPCTRDMLSEVPPKCSPPASAVATNPNTEPAVSTEAPNVLQFAGALAGMTCAAHSSFSTKIWQKQFKVMLSGSATELDKVKEVRYTVHSAYGRTYTASNRGNSFDAGATFLTPVTSWSIDQASLTDSSGQVYTIAKANLSWTDSDPDKKAGTPCETAE